MPEHGVICGQEEKILKQKWYLTGTKCSWRVGVESDREPLQLHFKHIVVGLTPDMVDQREELCNS